MRELRIVFMGTPYFAVGILEQLVESGANIVGVITAADKPAGRGRKLKASPVKEFALAHNLPVLQPTNLKNESFVTELKALNANLQIVVAFRMLPKVVWSMPAYGTFNLHASLLPQYRGAAPINWAVINGEKESGVTTFFIDEKIDTGAIIASEKITLTANETAGSLHDKLMDLGADLVLHTVELIQKNEAHPKAQPKEETFKAAPKLTSENTRIDWNQPSAEVDAFVRGLNPYPGAWTELHNDGEILKVKIYACEVVDTADEKDATHEVPGSLKSTKKTLCVDLADGALYIKELKLPGKRKMDTRALLNGYKIEEGAKFV